MELKTFKTREEAEAFIASEKETVQRGAANFQVEERFFVKRKIAFTGAPDEYLMEDGSFKQQG